MDDLTKQIDSVLASAASVEGLARVIHLAMARISDACNSPDLDAITCLLIDMVRLSAMHRAELIGIAGHGIAVQPEPEPPALQVH